MNLENSFKLYLSKTKGLSDRSVRNYLSDFRHFWQWATLVLVVQSKNGQNLSLSEAKNKALSQEFIISSLTPSLLQKYRSYLSTNNIAKSTAKRRLATLRAFCQFCQDQRWLKQNPALELENPSVTKGKEKEINDLLSKFGVYLKETGASKNTIKNYVADVRQYLKSFKEDLEFAV